MSRRLEIPRWVLKTCSRFYFVVSTAVYCALGYYYLLTALGVYIDVSISLYHLHIIDSKRPGLALPSTPIGIRAHIPFSHSPLHCGGLDAFLPHMGYCGWRNERRISRFPNVQRKSQIKRQYIRQLLRLGVCGLTPFNGYHTYTRLRKRQNLELFFNVGPHGE